MNNKTVVYFPDKMIKQGYISIFRDIFAELNKSQWLIYQLIKRNYSALYKQSALGFLWILIVPLVTVGIFIFLNGGGVFDIGDMTIPYPLFAVGGTAIWQVFSVGLSQSSNSLVSAGPMVTKINFTRKSLVIAAIAQGALPSLIAMVIVFILFASYHIVPPLTALLVPFAMIPLLLFVLGLGFLLSLINGVLRDVGNVIPMAITFLLFATPVLYSAPPSGIVFLVSKYNPLYYLVSVPRDLFVVGKVMGLEGFVYAALFSVAVFVIGLLTFHLSETRITERI
ncbi:ABC transporter permease [Chloroflexota bacterium]